MAAGNRTADGMGERREIPLFPLGDVLFTGGRMPLNVFEPRYLDLVRRCMKDDTGFGVVLIRAGSDVYKSNRSAPPTLFQVGTYARIVDFDRLKGGRLEITCAGGDKFRIRRDWEAEDHLRLAEVEFLPPEQAAPVDERYRPLVETLRLVCEYPPIRKLGLDVDFDDARYVGWRLAELLPLEAETKQALLQMQLPQERLLEIDRLVSRMQE